jgi:hypothetical protein
VDIEDRGCEVGEDAEADVNLGDLENDKNI